MTENISISDVRAMMGDGDSGMGGNNWIMWIILIFLFFLAFAGNGLGGRDRSGMEQVERDVLTTSCDTQKEVLENRYANALQFANLQAQQAACCCEIKTAVHAEGETTRALIQQNYIEALRTELSDAKTTLSNAAQSQYMLGQLGMYYPRQGVNPCNVNNCGCGC